jgi:hypothetical protein
MVGEDATISERLGCGNVAPVVRKQQDLQLVRELGQ